MGSVPQAGPTPERRPSRPAGAPARTRAAHTEAAHTEALRTPLPPPLVTASSEQAPLIPVSWTANFNFRRPEFTPFVPTLRQASDAALRRMFGLPETVELGWTVRRDDAHRGLRAHVRIGPLTERLEFDLHEGATDGWFSGRRFSAVLRGSASTTDAALLARLRNRLGAIDEATRASARDLWEPVREALETELSFQGVRDEFFCEVSDSEAIVRLGFRCNQKCEFCWQNRAWPDPPDHLYAIWVDEMAAAGIHTITFSGGEPTIHRQFLDLVRRARAHGMDVVVQTNAIRLARPGFADAMAEAGVGRLFVSFHSHVAEISDAMTSAPKTHARTREGIAEALRAGLRVVLNCVVERRNHDTLGDHARAIVEWFVTPFPNNPVLLVEYSHPCSYYREELWPAASVPLDEVQPYLVEAMRVLNQAGVPVGGIGTCGFPPCMLHGTDLPLRGMHREAENEGDVSGRLYAPECDQCVFKPHCLGLRREYMDIHGSRGVRPYLQMPVWVAPEGAEPT